MKHIGKLFYKYDVKFPTDESLIIMIGENGTGKTLTLELLVEYYRKQHKNVLYFPAYRFLSVDQDQVDAILAMYKLMENDIFSKFRINGINLNCYGYGIISSGHVQIVNFLCNILSQPDKNFIVIIDEPERNLDMNSKLMLIDTLYNIKNVEKLIVATHSPEICANFHTQTKNITQFVKLI